MTDGRYVGFAEFKAQLRIDDVLDDGVLALALAAAEDQIDQHCRRGADGSPRPFTQDEEPTQRVYRHSGRQFLIDDAAEVDEVAVRAGSGWTVLEGWEPEPLNAEADGRPFTSIVLARPTVGRIRVTGKFGWPDVPPVVVQAALLQASRLAQRRNAAFGIATVPGLEGGGMRLLAKLDADVELLLRNVRRQTVLV